ncbi:hypothetical protein RNS11_12105, partial [Staphylococcus pseudintermedius]|nr:hypothetical protein [Staphylococcus pseudintermedius]
MTILLGLLTNLVKRCPARGFRADKKKAPPERGFRMTLPRVTRSELVLSRDAEQIGVALELADQGRT